MKKSPLRKSFGVVSATAAVTLAATGLVAPAANAAEVNVVADNALKACINTTILNQPATANITKEQMENQVKFFNCDYKGVTSLSGLEFAKNLQVLSVKEDVKSTRPLN